MNVRAYYYILRVGFSLTPMKNAHAALEEVYTEDEKKEAWTSAAKMVETYSDETITRWKEEMRDVR